MTKPSESIACPLCGSELTMAQIFSNEESQHAFARMAAVSVPLGARVLQYVTMFKPPKTRLTIAKQVNLLMELLPDLERQAIRHKGREWQAPLPAWAHAIDDMLAARDTGRLVLPLNGHGYLYAVLAGLADKHEARAEAQSEQERRTPRHDQVQVRGESMSIGDALQAVHGNRDSALLKIERDSKQAAPVPDAVRALRERLKNGGAA